MRETFYNIIGSKKNRNKKRKNLYLGIKNIFVNSKKFKYKYNYYTNLATYKT